VIRRTPPHMSDLHATPLPGRSGPLTLRLSLTDRCNFRCQYCMPAGSAHFEKQLLPLDQLLATTAWLAEHYPLDKIKLTGGEPLVRKDAVKFVAGLRALPGVGEVSMTTNGALLGRHAPDLKAAGLARVNVSLDSLDPRRFHELTRGGDLHATLEGIDAALRHGLTPVNINAVLLRSSWREDVPALLNYAGERGIEVRFIELMRTGTRAEWARGEFVSAAEVHAWLLQETDLIDQTATANGPARTMTIDWHERRQRVGWITPLSLPFCSDCNRLRMDALGQIRRCLMDGEQYPLFEALAVKSDTDVLNDVDFYLGGKTIPVEIDSETPMNAVGG